MRTKYAKTPLVILLYILAAALIWALGAAARDALGRLGRNALLLAEPITQNAAGADIWALEDLRDEKHVMATYEIRRQATAAAVQQSHRMNLIGTNSVYQDVMGYPSLNGGFFTKEAFDAGARAAVLNRRAASTLFGGGNLYGRQFELDGELWVVVGVISDDGADSDNIYVPATSELIGGAAASGGAQGAGGSGVSSGALMALLGGLSNAHAAAAIDALKDVGINESAYNFSRLGKAAAALGEMSDAALRFAAAALLALFAVQASRGARRAFRLASAEDASAAEDANAADESRAAGAERAPVGKGNRSAGADAGAGFAAVKKDNRAAADINVTGMAAAGGGRRFAIFKMIINIMLFAGFAAGALILARQIVGICITWQEIPAVYSFSGVRESAAFGGRLNALGNSQAAVTCLFAASVAASAAAQFAAAYVFKD